VSKIERRRASNRLDRLIFWAQLLGIPEDYLWFKLPEKSDRAPHLVGRPRASRSRADALVMADLTEVGSSLGNAAIGEDIQIRSSPGRFFPGVAIHAMAYRARSDGRVLVDVPGGAPPAGAGRGLIVGVDAQAGASYAMDMRRAGQRLGKLPDGAGLIVPRAYKLDDLTIGLVWAVANLDEALLSDDASLSAHRSRLASYEAVQTSSVERDVAEDLSPVSQMWLGSEFCARHILRNAAIFAAAPAFWTQERRGEDASAWLLFEHKIDYLRALAGRYSSGQRLSRAFCVPEAEVAVSSPWERVLFLLAASLMESFDIEVIVCPDPEYAAVDGFVLDERRQAIVASWVDVESLWHVDVTHSRPTVQDFIDARGYAHAHSATAALDPAGRLHALADYLQLDWRWFVPRCSELADYGSAGLFEPRSRLLSTAGVDQACQFVAGLPQ
jgi:hypothetical protein